MINHLKEKYDLTTEQILNELEAKEQRDTIPISIFNPRLGALESIVKYLIENRKMQQKEIASVLNRDLRTIWATYDKAKKKLAEPLDATSEIQIPIEIFSSRKLSVLESIVNHLKEEGMPLQEIAKQLQRNRSTIWTVEKRARKKIESQG